MTEMKWTQVLCSSGSDEDLVNSCTSLATAGKKRTAGPSHTFTSTVEILPITLDWWSSTGSDETPSSFINCSAWNNGLSPLEKGLACELHDATCNSLDGNHPL